MNENAEHNTFIMQKVNEIRHHSDINFWKYIKKRLNLADNATCVSKFKDLNRKCRWLNGPEFLMLDKNDRQKTASSSEIATQKMTWQLLIK